MPSRADPLRPQSRGSPGVSSGVCPWLRASVSPPDPQPRGSGTPWGPAAVSASLAQLPLLPPQLRSQPRPRSAGRTPTHRDPRSVGQGQEGLELGPAQAAPQSWGHWGTTGTGARSSWRDCPCRAEQQRGHPPASPSPGPTRRKPVRGARDGVLGSWHRGDRVAEPQLVPTAPTGRQWDGEPVRHSRLNSEHFPRPTHNIRNIIRQCQPAPRGAQPPRYPRPRRGDARHGPWSYCPEVGVWVRLGFG